MLKNHYFDFTVLTSRETYSVEKFEISGRDTLHYESRDSIIPTGVYRRTKETFYSGDVLIKTDNLRAFQIVQLLGPQSFYGISHYPDYSYLLDKKELPIYRVFL